MSPEQYLPFLKRVLKPRRLEHSISVMEVMGELASVYDLDPNRALQAGILHDAAKDLDPGQWQQLVQETGIPCYHDCDSNYLFYLHGPVGAALLQQELGITDALVLGAIESHTSYGCSPYFDHPLSWCLRFADVLEPTRAWHLEPFMRDRMDDLRRLVFGGSLEEAVCFQTATLIQWFVQKGFPIHPNMRLANLRFSARMKHKEMIQ